MSGVDVLAVLETQAALLDWLTKEEIAGDPLRRVHAAVAELIEAAERVGDACSPETTGWDDLQSALRRVKGDA